MAEVEAVLHDFMLAMKARDIDAAFSLFSQQAQTDKLLHDLARMIEEENYILFDGYSETEVVNFSMTVGDYQSPDPSAPTGKVGQVSGIVHYSDGTEGSFQAILQLEQNLWRLFVISIEASPKRLEPEI